MLDDPGLDPEQLRDAVRTSWGIVATSIAFVPGHDMQAASYELVAPDGSYFLKVHFGPVIGASLQVPSALHEAGVLNIPAPMRTGSSALWAAMDDRAMVLYPFVRGRSAMQLGLTGDQWVVFGRTLRAIHDSGLEGQFGQILPAEGFDMPAARSVKRILALAEEQKQPSAAGSSRPPRR